MKHTLSTGTNYHLGKNGSYIYITNCKKKYPDFVCRPNNTYLMGLNKLKNKLFNLLSDLRKKYNDPIFVML